MHVLYMVASVTNTWIEKILTTNIQMHICEVLKWHQNSRTGYSAQGFSQYFRIGRPKIHIWGELGVPILFHPIALYTQNMDIRVSKIRNRVSKRHPDTPLAKGLTLQDNHG